MHNINHERIFTYIGIAAIVLLIFGLGGWYLFLRNQQASIAGESNARGFSIGIPSFLGSRGSTAANSSPDDGASPEQPRTGGSAFSAMLGFGQAAQTSDAGVTPQQSVRSEETRAPRFWRVTSAPVAGASFDATSTRLRYVERASGHVFEADPFTGTVKRITNTLTPRVYEAFLGGGESVVIRTVEDGLPVTMGGRMSSTTQDGVSELNLTNLGADIRDITTYQGSPEVLMIASAGAQTHLIRSRVNGATPRQLLTLPGGDFRIQLAGENIVLTERAGSGVLGSAYRATTALIPLLKNLPGLTTTVQKQSQNILYSTDDGARLKLYVELANAGTNELPLATVAEKCAWAPIGPTAYCAGPQGTIPSQFLDRWYRGEAHTEDVWYSIDTASAKVDTLFKIDSSYGMDVENPSVDPTGKYIAFQNARDKSLWVLRIAE